MLGVRSFRALLRASCLFQALLRFTLAQPEDGLSNGDAWGLRLSLEEDHETCPDDDEGDCSLSLRQLRAQQSSIATAAGLKEASRSKELEFDTEEWRWGLSHDGRNLGTSCMWHNCDASRGETMCHHFRCLCKENYIAAGGRCVPKADAPTQALDTRTQESCRVLGYCDAKLGPAACFDSQCFCIRGYAFEDGRCVELSQTSTTITTTGDSAWMRFGLSHDARFNGGTCLIHNCDKTRGPQLCHHFRCLCKSGYIAAGGACVKRDLLPTQALSTRTGKSCTVSGYCTSDVGPAACIDSQCFCIQGFEVQGGICVKSAEAAENSNPGTQTTTTEFTTTTTLPMTPLSTDPEPRAAWDDDVCENAPPTSKCGKTAAWAKSDGIYSNPDWYPGVQPSDPVAKFQSALYEAGQGNCTKRPCIGGLPINVSKPHGMYTRTTRRVPPPKHPFEHNGIEWTKLTVKGKTAHVFAVGDWGGLAGTLPHDHKIVQYAGGHTQGPHVMGRYRVDPLTHFSTCSTPQMSDCFATWGKTCSAGGDTEEEKCCEKSCGWLEEVDTKAQSLVAEQMRKRALTSPPDYILNVGDNFYWGGVEGKCGQTPMSKVNSITATQFAWIFENVYSGPGLDGKPWLGVFGNHDWGGREFDAAWDQQIAYTFTSDRWVIPAPYWMQKVEYVDQGFTVDIFMTDSNVEDALEDVDESSEHNICGRAHNPPGASCAAIGGPASIHECHGWFQKLWDDGAEWVTKKLKDSSADWQFLVTHFPCGHNAEFYRDLHLKYGLDLMITGHVHFQKLYWSPEKLGGLTCFITGGGGGITSENAVELDSDDDHQYGFFHLQLSKAKVDIESINWMGNTIQKAVAEPYVGVETAKADLVPCEKPAAGSKCDQTVNWAKKDGIHGNPDWFPGLTPASSYEQFQNKFYREHKHGCGKPCLPR